MFRAQFCPTSLAIDRIFYSLWFSDPKLLPGAGPVSRCADCVYGVEGACVCVGGVYVWVVCVFQCVGVCVCGWFVGLCICVCVCEREREREDY
jgi:hypothetical protein